VDFPAPGTTASERSPCVGPDWQTNGVADNEAVIDAFCAEMHAQGITCRRIATQLVFSRFRETLT